MAKGKLSKHLLIAAMCCILLGLYPFAKGEGKRMEDQQIYTMEFSLGLVFDSLWKYSHHTDENAVSNFTDWGEKTSPSHYSYLFDLKRKY